MLIEIRKAGFVNKGAELMLYAALQKMKEAYPDADFVIAPYYRGARTVNYLKRAELGFFQKASFWAFGLQWGDFAVFLPKIIREMYGIVLDKEIDIVIDIAGFAYGDQWKIRSTKELAHSCRRWYKRGTRVILLPQALGPFSSPQLRKLIKGVADNVDLIFSRDPISYKHLIDATGERPNIKMAPDFTNLLNGIVPEYFDTENNQFCLVPNDQMVSKTSEEESKAYKPFMITCAKYLLENDQKPFILIHEAAKDKILAQEIADGVGGDIQIIQENHPLKIKGILGTCGGTISSRFHGLVSALSQGVPSLGTGWSHKYKMLFQDYGFDDGLMNILATEEEIRKKIDLIINPQSRKQIQSTITSKSEELKKKSEDMWAGVFKTLGTSEKTV